MAEEHTGGDEIEAEQDYITLINNTIRTNPKKKLEKLLEKVGGLKGKSRSSKSRHSHASSGGTGEGDSGIIITPQTCILSQAIRCNQKCINNLQIVRDNLLSSYMATIEYASNGKSPVTDLRRQLSGTVSNMIGLVSEASTLAEKIHENAMALHVSTDFFRNPRQLGILDFSRSGRLPLSHFSGNEGTLICLKWLCTSAQKLIKAVPEEKPGGLSSIRNNIVKIYTSFEKAMGDLRNSAEHVLQIFQILLYCSPQGKQILQDFTLTLKPQEINDIITELQMLRRQYDEINILLERLGWSLADIFGRCTGTEIKFEELQKDACAVNKFRSIIDQHASVNLNKAARSATDATKAMLDLRAKRVSSSRMNKPLTTSQSEGQLGTKKGKSLKRKGMKIKTGFTCKLEHVLGKKSENQKKAKDVLGSLRPITQIPTSKPSVSKGMAAKPPKPVRKSGSTLTKSSVKLQ